MKSRVIEKYVFIRRRFQSNSGPDSVNRLARSGLVAIRSNKNLSEFSKPIIVRGFVKKFENELESRGLSYIFRQGISGIVRKGLSFVYLLFSNSISRNSVVRVAVVRP